MVLQGLTKRVQTAVGGVVAAMVLRILYASIWWERVLDAPFDSGRESTPVIFAFWHGRLLMAPCHYLFFRRKRQRAPYMLISEHGDGRLIASAVRLMGIRSVAGSSSRGGLRALLRVLRELEAGSDVGFTPDGPRGPRYECKDGIVLTAQKSGRPVIPMSYSVARKWQLRSWDGMIVPKPFSRGVVVIGAPIVIGPEDDRDVARQRIQNALNEVNERADRYWTAL